MLTRNQHLMKTIWGLTNSFVCLLLLLMCGSNMNKYFEMSTKAAFKDVLQVKCLIIPNKGSQAQALADIFHIPNRLRKLATFDQRKYRQWLADHRCHSVGLPPVTIFHNALWLPTHKALPTSIPNSFTLNLFLWILIQNMYWSVVRVLVHHNQTQFFSSWHFFFFFPACWPGTEKDTM